MRAGHAAWLSNRHAGMPGKAMAMAMHEWS
jgi:hypothetical protein